MSSQLNVAPLPSPDTVPADLRERPQWVAWTYAIVRGRETKLPKNARTGDTCDAYDPANWSDFETAHRFAENQGCGIGFVFSADDPYAGVDFDDCVRDGSFHDSDVYMRALALNSYTEVSPSGEGVKVFLKARLPRPYTNAGVEVYDRKRFFTVTGVHMQGTPEAIESRQAEVEALVQEVFGKAEAQGGERRRAERIEGKIPEGERNNVLASEAGTMRRRGMTEDAIEAALMVENEARCEPPLSEREVQGIAHSISRYEPAEQTVEHGALLTDLGNCRRFAQQHRDTARYCPGLGWLSWDGRRWAKDADGAVMRLAKKTALSLYDEAIQSLQEATQGLALAQAAAAAGGSAAKDAEDGLSRALKAAKRRLAWAEQSQSRQRLDAMVALAQSEAALVVRMADLDRDPMVLNCKNGTLDLRTGTLREHRREDLLTKLAPLDYEPDARHSVLDEYLETATGGDGDFAAYLQRWAGYCLTGNTGEEQVALLLGPASTGKTTLVEALSTVLGDYAQKASFDTFLERGHANPGGARPDLARLPGVRLVTACEASAKASLDAVMLKELSGGDVLTVRSLYREPFSFKPQCKIVLATNEAPRVSDQDTGVWRRLRRLPFEHVIPEDKRDPRVKATLIDTTVGGPAVLAWAVKGCLTWQRQGLGQCAVVGQRTQELRADMDPLAAFFEECCVFGPGLEVPAKALREVYEQWCRDYGVLRPIADREWSQRLRAKGCEKAQGRRNNVKMKLWSGVGLAAEDDDAEGGTTGTTEGRFSAKSPIGRGIFHSRDLGEKGPLVVPVVPLDQHGAPEVPCPACGKHDWVWSPATGGYFCDTCAHQPATKAA